MAYTLRKTDENVLICEGAVVCGDVELGKGVSVWYHAVVRGDEGPIRVGENTNIQDGAVLHARTSVGRDCTIGHNAIVHGCTVGDSVLVGMGAVILNGAEIGNECIIGAGTLVTGKFSAPDGSMILGAPAKVVRALTDAEKERIRHSAREYLDMARQYRTAG